MNIFDVQGTKKEVYAEYKNVICQECTQRLGKRGLEIGITADKEPTTWQKIRLMKGFRFCKMCMINLTSHVKNKYVKA